MGTGSLKPTPTVPLVRPREGRWLGGVCAALAEARELRLGWVRAGFVIAGLAAGIGAVVYIACWLIIPSSGEPEESPGRTRAIVVLAQGGAACVGLAILAAGAAVATIFGFGWAVAAVAAAALVGGLLVWPRSSPAWALLPVAALTLPSVAVASAGLRLSTDTGSAIVAPRTLQSATYRSGLGTLLVDLRQTSLPGTGTIPLTIDAGVRRTIVALPENRCVHVNVSYHVTPFLGQFAALLNGRGDRPFAGLFLFGRASFAHSATVSQGGSAPGPTLQIHFSSMGGSLYVRNYPDDISPRLEPNWPGFPVYLEPRPDIRGTPKRAAQYLIRNWRIRYRRELASQRLINALMPGPCSPGGAAG